MLRQYKLEEGKYMGIQDLLPSADQRKRLQDIEANLLRRRNVGTGAGVVAIASASLQVVLALAEKGYLEKIGLIIYGLIRLRFDELAKLDISAGQIIGWVVLFAAAGTFFILRWTSLLLKESKEPFNYTFWVKPFEVVEKTPGKRFKLKGKDRFHLLHHDIAERLNQRIQRFSLLKEPPHPGGNGTKATPKLKRQSSHIHISGHLVVREEDNERWVVHVMPSIRIGPPGRPAILAPPVKYSLNRRNVSGNSHTGPQEAVLPDGLCPADATSENKHEAAKPDVKPVEYELSADEYNQIIERVYSRIATEVYAQLESDVRNKLSLFPGGFMRALALYHEAEDFARSNTVDAYERAIALYRDALRYFETMYVESLTKFLLHFPWLLWRLEVRYQHRWARVVTGYAKCLIYKREMSALAGRDRNSLFELPELLAPVIANINKLHEKICRSPTMSRIHLLLVAMQYPNPKDSWFNRLFGRSSASLFETQKRILFEIRIVDALAHYFMYNRQYAENQLKDAEAIAPDRVSKDPLYLLKA